MSVRATLALLALLVALVATAVVVQGPCGADRSAERVAVLPGLVAKEVRLIRATSGAGIEVLLSREGDGWLLGTAREPADGAAVDALLTDLARARVAAVVSTNSAKQAAYRTDAGAGVDVRLEAAGGKVLAAFVVGASGPDFASCYLRRDGSDEVLLVTPDLGALFSRPADSWRGPDARTAAPAPEDAQPKP